MVQFYLIELNAPQLFTISRKEVSLVKSAITGGLKKSDSKNALMEESAYLFKEAKIKVVKLCSLDLGVSKLKTNERI